MDININDPALFPTPEGAVEVMVIDIFHVTTDQGNQTKARIIWNERIIKEDGTTCISGKEATVPLYKLIPNRST